MHSIKKGRKEAELKRKESRTDVSKCVKRARWVLGTLGPLLSLPIIFPLKKKEGMCIRVSPSKLRERQKERQEGDKYREREREQDTSLPLSLQLCHRENCLLCFSTFIPYTLCLYSDFTASVSSSIEICSGAAAWRACQVLKGEKWIRWWEM